MKNDIINLFVDLVKIPSPSGCEEEIRLYLNKKLSHHGWNTLIDMSGNLVAYKNKMAKLWMVSHMDTVLQQGQIVKPVTYGDIISSDGTTILGADNKVGLSVLLYLATVENLLDSCGLIFTVNEEAGEMGSSKIDWQSFSPELIINLDGSEDVGVVNDSGMGQIVFEVEIFGKSAHAAKNPEDGINAIEIAALIISQIKQGSDEKQNTCNIGNITGGGATNVVPDYVKFVGEIRSHNNKGLIHTLEVLKKLVKVVSKKHGAKCKLTNLKSVGVPVWEKELNHKYRNVITKAASLAGIKLNFEKMYACSDANFLKNKAEVFSINHGGHKAHSSQEWIDVNDILLTKKYVKSIVSTFNKLFKI